jgi:hypothetical protein
MKVDEPEGEAELDEGAGRKIEGRTRAGRISSDQNRVPLCEAPGWTPYDPEKLASEKLGYGESPSVITNTHVRGAEKGQGKITRPSDGKEAFIQCVRFPGSGNDLPYCSTMLAASPV